jgi:putative membrane-bound dehydrogenase-like protein
MIRWLGRWWLLPLLFLLRPAISLAPAPAAEPGPLSLVPEDLARGKPATASDSQGGHEPGAANDGEGTTRWCAFDGSPGHWWQVDLGRPEDLTGCRITWESSAAYGYKVEGSANGATWQTLADATRADVRDQEREHAFSAREVRYVRVNVTGLEPGHWASFFECAVLGTRRVAAAPASGSTRPAGPKNRLLAGIKVPPGFEVTLFAAPPEVHYPTCLTAAPTGEVFVGVDENGSIDAKADRGRVLRCLDDDGDGVADRINVFARMDSPRGLVYDGGTLYVLHPPDLTAYHDDDGDGTADRSLTLVKGIGFDLKFRGADHTTNGIQLGIDGWLYIAVGDYGFLKAVGSDGTECRLRGGGIARVRTDGSGLEIYNRGQRNIYDVAIDPYLNIFTRDNTNDGGGWNVRLSQIVPTGEYGYPLLFTHFGDEMVPPLADYGGGSPTGSLYVQEPSLPAPYNDTLFTCDWGRSVVYRHPLMPLGAGFKAGQEPFVEIPRPTDMDLDGHGRIYLASWHEGKFTYDGPNVGYVVRLTYPGLTPPAFPDLKTASDAQLLEHLAAPSAILRLHAQRALLRRGDRREFAPGLEALARNDKSALSARVAAVFTLQQLLGRSASDALIRLAEDKTIREFALRALADRAGEAAEVPARPFVAALVDPDPRVRLQAVAALGRLDKSATAADVIPLLADPNPLVAHVTVRALVTLRAIEPCLGALDPSRPQLAAGAVRVLQLLHDPQVVDGLITKLRETPDALVRQAILKALCRLYRREAEWDGNWWGTRPDTSGPYFKPETWEKSEAILRVLRDTLSRGDATMLRWFLPELIRNKIDLNEATTQALTRAGQDPALRATTVELLSGRATLSDKAVEFLGDVAASAHEAPALRARALRGLQRAGGANQRAARGAAIAALAAVGASDNPPSDLLAAWQEFVRDNRNARDIREFVTLAEGRDASASTLAYSVLVAVEENGQASGVARPAIERAWSRPESTARLLRAIGAVRADRYSAQVQIHLKDADASIRLAAADAAHRLALDRTTARQGPRIAELEFERVLAGLQREKGDPELGSLLFQKQGCISCHTVAKTEPPKGPFLGDIANRYSRAELAESILKPSARIAQGFETQKFATTAGQVIEGFVVRESGDEIELRGASGTVTVIPKGDIDERGASAVSVMPTGLADSLTVTELASILAYLERLRDGG